MCAESDDEVSLVRYGPNGAEVVKTVEVGSYPTETEGPHGITVGPGGRYWYVSIAHGFPFGSVHKYETGTDRWVDDVTLGLFPATLAVSPATGLLHVVNFNLHGAMEPSTISAVEAETMIEVGRIPTGIMPHGSRFSRDGTRHYSVNMMGAELVEVDALAFAVRRRLHLGDGVQPTWVTSPTAGGRVYVTGNNVARIFEVDLETWQVERTFETGAGPYNLDVASRRHDAGRHLQGGARPSASGISRPARSARGSRRPAPFRMASSSPRTASTRSSRWRGWAASRARWRSTMCRRPSGWAPSTSASRRAASPSGRCATDFRAFPCRRGTDCPPR